MRSLPSLMFFEVIAFSLFCMPSAYYAAFCSPQRKFAYLKHSSPSFNVTNLTIFWLLLCIRKQIILQWFVQNNYAKSCSFNLLGPKLCMKKFTISMSLPICSIGTFQNCTLSYRTPAQYLLNCTNTCLQRRNYICLCIKFSSMML